MPGQRTPWRSWLVGHFSPLTIRVLANSQKLPRRRSYVAESDSRFSFSYHEVYNNESFESDGPC